jgi:hypothetical protein
MLIAGDVSLTTKDFSRNNPGLKIAMLYMDVDLELPTYDVLNNLWDNMTKGGLIVFDEYGHHKWSESKGVDRFLEEKNLESKKYCKNYSEVHISNLSCLSYAIKCNPKIPIFIHPPYHKSKNYISIPNEIGVHFPEVRIEKEPIPRFFSNNKILFYAPHLDGIEKLYNLPKDSGGIILLQFPYHSRDKSKEWNDNKYLLRIPDTWKF